jgi:sigma-E factor negative regulatory protein RseC
MIEEKATVIAVEGEHALLQTQRRSACQSCSVKQGCGTSVLAKVVGQRSSQILVDNVLNAEVGDEIIIGINDNALVKGSFLVYALPLVLLLIGALMGEFFAHAYGFNAELLSIIAGTAGFVVAMILIRFSLSKTKFKAEIQPHMLRISHHGAAGHNIFIAP